MTIEIEISEEFLERFGNGTLVGTMMQRTGERPTDVVLVFPQTTLGWRQKNKGPKHYVLPEFVPLALVLDVINLVESGIRVTVKTKNVESLDGEPLKLKP